MNPQIVGTHADPDGIAMAAFIFVAPIVAFGVSVVPTLLLRRGAYPRAQDYFVSSGCTPPRVLQNSAVAYALKLAMLGPLFAWGASGELWPAIISAVCWGLGLCLVYVLRQPIVEFLGNALSIDKSVTVHAFIAQCHGDDRRVRLLASGLTVFALAGLVMCEALALASILRPLLTDAAATFLFTCTILMVAALGTIVSGNSGAMYAGQLQLGLLYLGIFGSAAFSLYMQISSLGSMPPYGTFANLFVAVFSLVLLCYRRSRYVDHSLITTGGRAAPREPFGARLLMRFQKILNPFISVFAVLNIILAAMELYANGLATILPDLTSALRTGARVPGLGLATLSLLALFYPLVDITNWQRIAAFEKDREQNCIEPARWPAVFGGAWTIYSVESPSVWLFVCMFGAIAAIATAMPDGSGMAGFTGELASQDNLVTSSALSLLVMGASMAALSTIGPMFSAGLWVLRNDVLPLRPPAALAEEKAVGERRARRHAITACSALLLVVIAGCYVAGEVFRITLASDEFLALFFLFSCAQLALLPLVLVPLVARMGGTIGSVTPAWALVVLGTGAGAGIGTVAVYLATGDAPFLWAAVPACVGSGSLVSTIALLLTRRGVLPSR